MSVLVLAYLVYALLRGENALMTAQGWLQIAFFFALLTALTPLLGAYMARVYRGRARAAHAACSGRWSG